jgi:hypothetical protein
MDRAIRHSDGQMITDTKWNTIKNSARMIKHELHQLPVPQQRLLKSMMTKSYYRINHPKEWQAAILKLETMQPLLQLCASNWKADHVLGIVLQGSPDHGEDTSATHPKNQSRHKKRQEKEKGREKAEEKELNSDDASECTLLTICGHLNSIFFQWIPHARELQPRIFSQMLIWRR